MLLADLLQELGGRAGASGFYIFIAAANAGHGVLVVLLLPIQRFSQNVIQRGCGVLPVALCVRFQLCLAFA